MMILIFNQTNRVSGVTWTLRWAGIDEVLSTEDDVFLETTSDATGMYQFSHLPFGNYMNFP
ncbi:MAG: SpaA isopeptide-forming pilin-related protein [Saprospiraceae bacterium]